MRGSGSPTRTSTIRVPPKAVLSSTRPGGRPGRGRRSRRPRRADGSAARRARRRQRPLRVPVPVSVPVSVPGYDHDHPALAGHVERVDAQQLAGPAYGGPYGHRVLLDHDGDAGGAGDLVQNRRHAAPGRVPQAPHLSAHGGQEGGDQAVERGGVRRHVGLDVQLAPGQHDRDAVLADRAGHEDGVAGPGVRDTERRIPLQQSDPGRGDVAAVGLAALHHLGVPGHDRHLRRRGGPRHRRADPPQVLDREALLQDETGRQVQRPGPAHRKVVHGAVDGEVADVAAGEEQRGDHVGVGREREPRAARGEDRAVLQRFEQRVAERVEEHRLDQRLGRLAARAVGHRDVLLAHAGLPLPGAVDAFEDLFLAGRPGLGHLVASLTRCREKRPKL